MKRLWFNPARPLEGKRGQSELSTSQFRAEVALTLAFIFALVCSFIVMSVKPFFVVPLFGAWFYRYYLKVHFMYRGVYLDLTKLINSASLVDYDPRRRDTFNRPIILHSVMIDYLEDENKIQLVIYPNGIKNSREVYKLTKKIGEVFGYPAYIEKVAPDKVTYVMPKRSGRLKIDDKFFD
ncbi:hypothetical protein [Limosilactobacillus ingluviei]|uniref:hypothetical protein n=1 Tax=Limosilactobacillus ingluviei TaxID=148604 RepID=UPI0005942D09|nr:hypothetical protein [Limosilactobacillus ingluviei]